MVLCDRRRSQRYLCIPIRPQFVQYDAEDNQDRDPNNGLGRLVSVAFAESTVGSRHWRATDPVRMIGPAVSKLPKHDAQGHYWRTDKTKVKAEQQAKNDVQKKARKEQQDTTEKLRTTKHETRIEAPSMQTRLKQATHPTPPLQ